MYSLLIVDDEDLARYAVRKMISRLSSPVEVCGEADSATSAREIVARLKPDIVVMDINMPGMNGLEAARQIREAHPPARVLIISAHDSFAFAQRAVQLQLDGYLLKPVRESDFAEEIQRIIGRIEEQRQLGVAGPETGPGTAPDTRPGKDADEETGVAPHPYPREAEREYLALLHRPGNGTVSETGSEAIDRIVSLFFPHDVNLVTARRHVIEFVAFLYRELERLPGQSAPVLKKDFFERITRCSDPQEVRRLLSSVLHEVAGAFTSREEETLLQQVEEYLQTHALHEVSLERVSEHLEMTPQHLSRIFKERYGIKFLEFATEKRIERAKELLISGTCTVAEAGRIVGYTDTHYFSRLFRQTTGLPPRAYARSRASR